MLHIVLCVGILSVLRKEHNILTVHLFNMETLQWLLLCSMLITVTMATGYKNCKTMATFNVGLINSVGKQSSRLPLIIDALKRSKDDFICMQEVWLEEDMSVILEAVKGEYPHHWSKIHAARDYLREPTDQCQVIKETPCTLAEAVIIEKSLTDCALQYGCFDLSPSQQTVCFIVRCMGVLQNEAIRETCLPCSFLKFPLNFVLALRECITPTERHNRVNQPGLLVLSKQRFNRVAFSDFFPGARSPLKRGFIEAELDDGKVTVCTHLTHVTPIYIEFDLPFSSYFEQATREITIIGQTYADKKHILLGDVNTGPAVRDKPGEKNLTAEYPSNYEKLISFGYSAPYLEQDGRCTACADNPLIFNYPNTVIDQVFIHPPDAYAVPFTERAYDQTDPVLSDHFGVRADVCDP